MLGVALVLAAATIGGVVSPWLLLILTFALCAGDAMATPAWRAALPDLVGKADLAAATALNGIEFNSRAPSARHWQACSSPLLE